MLYSVNICDALGVKIRLATFAMFETYEQAEEFVKNADRSHFYTISIIGDLGP